MSSPTKSILPLPNLLHHSPTVSQTRLTKVKGNDMHTLVVTTRFYKKTKSHAILFTSSPTKSTLPLPNLLHHSPTVSQTRLTKVKGNDMHTLVVTTRFYKKIIILKAMLYCLRHHLLRVHCHYPTSYTTVRL